MLTSYTPTRTYRSSRSRKPLYLVARLDSFPPPSLSLSLASSLPTLPCPSPTFVSSNFQSKAPLYSQMWEGMQAVCDAGLARHIGISMASTAELSSIVEAGLPAPQIAQDALSPFSQQTSWVRQCAELVSFNSQARNHDYPIPSTLNTKY